MERRATLSVTQKPFAFAFATKLTRLLRIRVFLQARYTRRSTLAGSSRIALGTAQ